MAKFPKEDNELIKKAKTTHEVWHKFYNWMVKTYGKDLHGEWQFMESKNAETGKPFKIKYRSYNELELSRRLVGYEVMEKVERYVKKCCPEIKIIHCDDHHHAGSIILLIPHPKMGITVIFIPQCTTIQNQFFLYENHCKALIKGLAEMKKVYKNKF